MIWLTTSNGIGRIDTDEVLTGFTAKDGFPEGECSFIIQAGIWHYVGTDDGLCRFDGDSGGSVKIFNENDGLLSDGLEVYLLDREGNIWLGGAYSGGLTVFDVGLDVPSKIPPPVFISGFKVFGRDTTVVDGLQFPHNMNYISFDFVGLCFSAPDKVSYRYRMDNLEQEWNLTGKRTAAYPYLPPGRYTFKVTALNNDGVQSPQPASVSFIIRPPFWATLWFRTATLISLILILLGLYNMRIRRLRKWGWELEKQVDERTKELRDAQTQLVQSEKMASLGSLAAGMAHEINNPIGSIISSADTLKRALTKIRDFLAESVSLEELRADDRLRKTFNIIEKNTESTHSAGERIMKIVKNLKNFSRLDEAEFQRADIRKGIEATIKLTEHEFPPGVTLNTEFGPIPELECYPNELNQLFLNLLLNAAQAISGQGNVSIKTDGDAGNIYVTITDTGVGIPPENIDKIFNPGFTTKGVGVGAGLGLAIAYNIVKKHGGSIDVNSELDVGTEVLVSIPVNR
jgi:signal transduction histidine kinase